MNESTTKKILDSALSALLAGVEVSPWVKVPATFVKELSSRFGKLPDNEKQALVVATTNEIRQSLNNSALELDTNEPDQLADVIFNSFRGRLVSYLNDLASPAVDLLVANLSGASKNVTKNAPVRTRIAELIEWSESAEGPGLYRLATAARFSPESF